jgi:hypothetical protein
MVVHHAGCAQLVPNPFTSPAQFLVKICVQAVDIYRVAASQQTGEREAGVCRMGFLPTMKPQLSQLPLIVGYGRVNP